MASTSNAELLFSASRTPSATDITRYAQSAQRHLTKEDKVFVQHIGNHLSSPDLSRAGGESLMKYQIKMVKTGDGVVTIPYYLIYRAMHKKLTQDDVMWFQQQMQEVLHGQSDPGLRANYSNGALNLQSIRDSLTAEEKQLVSFLKGQLSKTHGRRAAYEGVTKRMIHLMNVRHAAGGGFHVVPFTALAMAELEGRSQLTSAEIARIRERVAAYAPASNRSQASTPQGAQTQRSSSATSTSRVRRTQVLPEWQAFGFSSQAAMESHRRHESFAGQQSIISNDPMMQAIFAAARPPVQQVEQPEWQRLGMKDASELEAQVAAMRAFYQQQEQQQSAPNLQAASSTPAPASRADAVKRFQEQAVNIKRVDTTQALWSVPPMPSLPAAARNIDVDAIVSLFDRYSPDSSLLRDDDNSQLSNSQARDNLRIMVNVAKGQMDRYGMPRMEAEREQYRKNLTFLMRHVIHMLRTCPSADVNKMVLGPLAVGGGHCAARYVQEAIQAINNLRYHSTEPHYAASSTRRGLLERFNEADLMLYDWLQKKMSSARKAVFDSEIAKLAAEMGNYDESHTRNYYMKHAGQALGLEGAEFASYNDVFHRLANRRMGGDGFTAHMRSLLTPEYFVNYLRDSLRYNPGGGNRSHDNVDFYRSRIIDLMKKHAPERFKDDVEDFVQDELFDDEYLFEQNYLIQLMQHFDLLSAQW